MDFSERPRLQKSTAQVISFQATSARKVRGSSPAAVLSSGSGSKSPRLESRGCSSKRPRLQTFTFRVPRLFCRAAAAPKVRGSIPAAVLRSGRGSKSSRFESRGFSAERPRLQKFTFRVPRLFCGAAAAPEVRGSIPAAVLPSGRGSKSHVSSPAAALLSGRASRSLRFNSCGCSSERPRLERSTVRVPRAAAMAPRRKTVDRKRPRESPRQISKTRDCPALVCRCSLLLVFAVLFLLGVVAFSVESATGP